MSGIVSVKHPLLLRRWEQLLFVGAPGQPNLGRRPHGMPGPLQRSRDCPGNVVVKIQVGQGSLFLDGSGVQGDLSIDEVLMLSVVGYRRRDGFRNTRPRGLHH